MATMDALQRMFGMTDYDDIAEQVADADANPNINSILLGAMEGS